MAWIKVGFLTEPDGFPLILAEINQSNELLATNCAEILVICWNTEMISANSVHVGSRNTKREYLVGINEVPAGCYPVIYDSLI